MHGIHVLQGWYYHAFGLVREVYDERLRKRLSPSSPFQHWEDAFDPDDGTLMIDRSPVTGEADVYLVRFFRRTSSCPGRGGTPRAFSR